MSRTYREQHPLLCDELSEDEHFSPLYSRRNRPMTHRGRARNNLKGAAAIFKLWPDHWATFLTYWWIALGMLALTTLIVYNALFAFAVIPQDSTKPLKQTITKNMDRKQKLYVSDVYMHIFCDVKDEVDLHQYIPYIEIISKKYPDFKYHLVIVMNDTSLDTSHLIAEENNEIALNSLWSKDKTISNNLKINDITSIEYVTLSEYMNNSPLKKNWRSLSIKLVQFLVRALSIWNKGGIVFDPIILTPRSPHAAYIEKLQNIIQNFNRREKLPRKFKLKKNSNKKSKKYKPRVNNIRDIIEVLENEDNVYSEQTLTEAENKNDLHVTRNVRNILSVTERVNETSKKIDTVSQTYSQMPEPVATVEESIELDQKNGTHLNISQPISQTNMTKTNLLPLFLEYLFQNRVNAKTSKEKSTTNNYSTKESKIIEKFNENISSVMSNDRQKSINDNHKPIIVSTKFIPNKVDETVKVINSSKSDSGNQLIIDLRGNIIATETPCHAFLGTVFSNAIHHTDDVTVTDFIITELSLFCKGLLSTCMGIDLILL